MREEAIDAAIVFCSAMAQYVPPGADLPTIVDYVDVDSEKWRVYGERKPWPLSWVYRTEANRLLRYERQLAKRYDESVFVAEKEADVFRLPASLQRGVSKPLPDLGEAGGDVGVEGHKKEKTGSRPAGAPVFVEAGPEPRVYLGNIGLSAS